MKTMTRTFAILTALFLIFVAVDMVLAEGPQAVNINTADVEQLTQLNRIGPSYAARIVEYRQINGLFKTPEDLMQVPGIGSKTFDLNKDRIVVK
jgi:competence protein ComEA